MADTPEILKEAKRKLAAAEEDKQRHKSRYDDCYKYALPWRHTLDTDTHTDVDEVDALVDATALVTVPDFAADMLSTFTPRYVPWMEVHAAEGFDEKGQLPDEIVRALQDFQEVIFDEIGRSNFYEAAEESYLDLAAGTMSMQIDDIHGSMPIHCEATATPDLIIKRGPFSSVDGRWRSRMMDKSDVPVLWPDAEIPDSLKVTVKGNRHEVQIYDGLMRDWSDVGTERWHYLVWSGNDLLVERKYTGSGSCPQIVGRWLADRTTAWGVGPLNLVLPWVKLVDKVELLMLEQMEFAVDPPFSYDDDGVINFDNGLEPGTGLPRAPGSKIEPIDRLQQFDVGAFQLEEMRSEIRRALFQDKPDQVGKTPPTATQWLDEAAKRARRMGSPAGRLIVEWQIPIFQRFAYLLHKRGKLPSVELNGKQIGVHPVSPLMNALREEETQRYARFAEILVATIGPEQAFVLVNSKRWAQHIAKTMGVDLSIMNTEQEIQQAVADAAQVAQEAGVLPEGEAQ